MTHETARKQALVIALNSDCGLTALLQRIIFHKVILLLHHKAIMESRLQHVQNSAYHRFYHLYKYLQDIVRKMTLALHFYTFKWFYPQLLQVIVPSVNPFNPLLIVINYFINYPINLTY